MEVPPDETTTPAPVTFSLPIIPPPILPPPPPPTPKPLVPFLNPAFQNKLFQRCLRTDISRQLIYRFDSISNTYTQVKLPDREECLFHSYPELDSPTETFYDALGNPVDSSTVDECGIPSLPNLRYIKTAGLSLAQLTALASTVTLSHKALVETRNRLSTYWCQVREDPPASLISDYGMIEQEGLGPFGAPPPATPFIGIGPVICGMPNLYVNAYCVGKSKGWDTDAVVGEAIILDRLVAPLPAQIVGNYELCTADDYDGELSNLYTDANAAVVKANELGFVFKLDVPTIPPDPNRIWLRQAIRIAQPYIGVTPAGVPSNVDASGDRYYHTNWKIARMKRSPKSIFMPYPFTSENGRRTSLSNAGPTYLFDCFGNKLKKYDDCGQLAFTITRLTPGTSIYVALPPPVHRQPMVDLITGAIRMLSCWEHQFDSDIACGIEKNLPNFNEWLNYVCLNFEEFHKKGGFPQEFIEDD